jgi:hypothetical protein
MKIITTTLVLIITTALTQLDAAENTQLSYDLFGVYATHDKDGDDNNAFGIGLGVNYFFSDHMGVGVDSYTDGIRLPYMLNASFIYRFINDGTFNPYAFTGIGKQWDYASQWTGHIGGGAEYTLKSGMNLFADARFVLAQEESNYGLLRLGVRLGF